MLCYCKRHLILLTLVCLGIIVRVAVLICVENCLLLMSSHSLLLYKRVITKQQDHVLPRPQQKALNPKRPLPACPMQPTVKPRFPLLNPSYNYAFPTPSTAQSHPPPLPPPPSDKSTIKNVSRLSTTQAWETPDQW